MIDSAAITVGLDVAVHDWNGRDTRPDVAQRARVVSLPNTIRPLRTVVHFCDDQGNLLPYDPDAPFDKKGWEAILEMTEAERTQYGLALAEWAALKGSQDIIRTCDIYSTWADYSAGR